MKLTADELRACCASRRWLEVMLAGEPYADLDEACDTSDRAITGLAWADVEDALAAHPRIGQRPAGDGREARWSRGEQSAATAGGTHLAGELVEGNRAYERRFGHVFLVCATGLSAEKVLASLRGRLDNDPATERDVVREELRKIVRLRLAKLVSGHA
jgi:2-oxo-4-hydroxy-4-carboxy-5-ureidoimidazoline decarboxylase